MKFHRVFSTAAVVTLVLGCLFPLTIKAQEALMFEGMVAYVGADGNIVLATGDGAQAQITTDANLDEFSPDAAAYHYLNFSPNGAYLAYYRSGASGLGSGIFIYDVSAGSVIGRLPEDVRSPVVWHRDSDSFYIKEREDINIGSGTINNRIYRLYLSGEKVQLGEYYEDDAGYVINYNLDMVFYTPESNTPMGTFYNWAQNTNYQIALSDFSVVGYWSRDGLTYVHKGDDSAYTIIDLKTGGVTKTIDGLPPLEHVYPDGNTYNLSATATDLSPDATRLLLNNDLNLYELDFNTSIYQILYTSIHDDPDYRLYGTWSSSGNLIMFDEFSVNSSYYDDVLDDQSINVLSKGAPPILAATNAEFLFWLSKDSERFLYNQYIKAGGSTLVDLMVFDATNRTNLKIGSLPTINDPGYDPFRFNFLVAWTENNAGLSNIAPSMPFTPLTEESSLGLNDQEFLQTPVAAPPTSTPSSSPTLFTGLDASYLLACLLCLLFLIVLAVLFAIFMARSRKRKDQTQQEQRETRMDYRSHFSNEGRVGHAIGLAKAKKYQEALDILQTVVQTEAGNASAWFNLGRVYASMGNFENAKRCFLQAGRLGHSKADEALGWLRNQKSQ